MNRKSRSVAGIVVFLAVGDDKLASSQIVDLFTSAGYSRSSIHKAINKISGEDILKVHGGRDRVFSKGANYLPYYRIGETLLRDDPPGKVIRDLRDKKIETKTGRVLPHKIETKEDLSPDNCLHHYGYKFFVEDVIGAGSRKNIFMVKSWDNSKNDLLHGYRFRMISEDGEDVFFNAEESFSRFPLTVMFYLDPRSFPSSSLDRVREDLESVAIRYSSELCARMGWIRGSVDLLRVLIWRIRSGILSLGKRSISLVNLRMA